MNKLMKIAFFFLLCISTAFAQPIIRLGADTLRFGTVSMGGDHSRDFGISNIGDSALVISGLGFPDTAFALITPALPDTILQNQQHFFTIAFRPEENSPFDGILTISSNDTITPVDTIVIRARGTRAFAPGEIIWSYQGIADIVSLAVPGDVNNDGFPDVAAESYDLGAAGNHLLCISGSGQGTGQLIWSARPSGHSTAGGFGDQCLISPGDMNLNGTPDLVLGTGWDNRTIFAIEGRTGQTIWSHNTYSYQYSGWIYSVASMGDLNGDHKPEILAGVGSDANFGLGLNGANGARFWKRPTDDVVASVCRIDDVTGDSIPDAILGAGDIDYRILCLSGAISDTGMIKWSYVVGASISTVDRIADLNNDGYNDIIVGTWSSDYRVMAISGHVDSTHARLIWSTPVGQPVMRAKVCDDLNGDGLEDIVVGSWGHYTLALSGADGHELWRNEVSDDVWTVYPAGDINGDSIPEIIAGSLNGNVMLLSGATGQTIWSTQTGSRIVTVRPIGDVNGDGKPDILAGQQKLGSVGGKVLLLSGGGVVGREWVDDSTSPTPGDYLSLENYPNPFNAETAISYSLSVPAHVTLEIYNIMGQRLLVLVNQFQQPGPHKIIWNGRDSESKSVASGVYFGRLVAGELHSSRKLTVLR